MRGIIEGNIKGNLKGGKESSLWQWFPRVYEDEEEEEENPLLFLFPFKKSAQVSQRLSNMIGTRPMKEVNRDVVRKIYSGEYIDPQSLQEENFNVGIVDSALPQQQFEYVKRVREEEEIKKAKQGVTQQEIDRRVQNRLRRELSQDPGTFNRGIIEQGRPRLIGVALGSSHFSDFSFNNPEYEAEFGYSFSGKVQFNVRDVYDVDETKLAIAERLAPGTRIFSSQMKLDIGEGTSSFFDEKIRQYRDLTENQGYTPQEATSRIKNSLDENLKESLTFIPKDGSLEVEISSGAYQFDKEGKPYKTASMDSYGYLTVGHKSSRTPFGDEITPIKVKNPANKEKYESGVSVITHMTKGVRQGNQFKLEFKGENIKIPGMLLRPGVENIKGPSVYLQPAYFQMIAETLNRQESHRDFLPNRVTSGQGQNQIAGKDIYGVYGPGSLKSFNVESGAYILGHPETRRAMLNQSGEEIAQMLSLLFLDDKVQVGFGNKPISELLKKSLEGQTDSSVIAELERRSKKASEGKGKLRAKGDSSKVKNLSMTAMGILAFAKSSPEDSQQGRSVYDADISIEGYNISGGSEKGKVEPLEEVRNLVGEALSGDEGSQEAQKELRKRMETLISTVRDQYSTQVEGDRLSINTTSPITRGASLVAYLSQVGRQILYPTFTVDKAKGAVYDSPHSGLSEDRQKRNQLARQIVDLELREQDPYKGGLQKGLDDISEDKKLSHEVKESVAEMVQATTAKSLRNTVRKQHKGEDEKVKEIEDILEATHYQLQTQMMVAQMVKMSPSQSLVATGTQNIGKLEYQYLQQYNETLKKEFFHEPDNQEMDIRIAYSMISNASRGDYFPDSSSALRLESSTISHYAIDNTIKMVNQIARSLPNLEMPDGGNLSQTLAERMLEAQREGRVEDYRFLLERSEEIKREARQYIEGNEDLTEERIDNIQSRLREINNYLGIKVGIDESTKGQVEEALRQFRQQSQYEDFDLYLRIRHPEVHNDLRESGSLEDIVNPVSGRVAVSDLDSLKQDYRSRLRQALRKSQDLSVASNQLQGMRTLWLAANKLGYQEIKQELNRTREIIIPRISFEGDKVRLASLKEAEPIRLLQMGLEIDQLKLEYPGFEDRLLELQMKVRNLNEKLRGVDEELKDEGEIDLTSDLKENLMERESAAYEIRRLVADVATTSMAETAAGDYKEIPGSSFAAVRSFMVNFDEVALGGRIDDIKPNKNFNINTKYLRQKVRDFLRERAESEKQKRGEELKKEQEKSNRVQLSVDTLGSYKERLYRRIDSSNHQIQIIKDIKKRQVLERNDKISRLKREKKDLLQEKYRFYNALESLKYQLSTGQSSSDGSSPTYRHTKNIESIGPLIYKTDSSIKEYPYRKRLDDIKGYLPPAREGGYLEVYSPRDEEGNLVQDKVKALPPYRGFNMDYQYEDSIYVGTVSKEAKSSGSAMKGDIYSQASEYMNFNENNNRGWRQSSKEKQFSRLIQLFNEPLTLTLPDGKTSIKLTADPEGVAGNQTDNRNIWSRRKIDKSIRQSVVGYHLNSLIKEAKSMVSVESISNNIDQRDTYSIPFKSDGASRQDIVDMLSVKDLRDKVEGYYNKSVNINDIITTAESIKSEYGSDINVSKINRLKESIRQASSRAVQIESQLGQVHRHDDIARNLLQHIEYIKQFEQQKINELLNNPQVRDRAINLANNLEATFDGYYDNLELAGERGLNTEYLGSEYRERVNEIRQALSTDTSDSISISSRNGYSRLSSRAVEEILSVKQTIEEDTDLRLALKDTLGTLSTIERKFQKAEDPEGSIRYLEIQVKGLSEEKLSSQINNTEQPDQEVLNRSRWISSLYQDYRRTETSDIGSSDSPLTEVFMRGLQGDRNIGLSEESYPSQLTNEINRLHQEVESRLESEQIKDRLKSEFEDSLVRQTINKLIDHDKSSVKGKYDKLRNLNQVIFTLRQKKEQLKEVFNSRLKEEIGSPYSRYKVDISDLEIGQIAQKISSSYQKAVHNYMDTKQEVDSEIKRIEQEIANVQSGYNKRIQDLEESKKQNISLISQTKGDMRITQTRIDMFTEEKEEIERRKKSLARMLPKDSKVADSKISERSEWSEGISLIRPQGNIIPLIRELKGSLGFIEAKQREIEKELSGKNDAEMEKYIKSLQDKNMYPENEYPHLNDETRSGLESIVNKSKNDNSIILSGIETLNRVYTDQGMVQRGGAPSNISQAVEPDNKIVDIGGVEELINKRTKETGGYFALALERSRTAMVMSGYGPFYTQQGDYDGDTYIALLSKTRFLADSQNSLIRETLKIEQKAQRIYQTIEKLKTAGLGDSYEVERLNSQYQQVKQEASELRGQIQEKDEELKGIIEKQQERKWNRADGMQKSIRAWTHSYTGFSRFAFMEEGSKETSTFNQDIFGYAKGEEVLTTHELSTWMNSLRNVNEQMMLSQEGQKDIDRLRSVLPEGETVSIEKVRGNLEEGESLLNSLKDLETGNYKPEDLVKLISRHHSFRTGLEDFTDSISNLGADPQTSEQVEASLATMGITGGQVLGEAYNAFVPMMHQASALKGFQEGLQSDIRIEGRTRKAKDVLQERLVTKLREEYGSQEGINYEKRAESLLDTESMDEYYRSINQLVSNIQVIVRDDALKPSNEGGILGEVEQVIREEGGSSKQRFIKPETEYDQQIRRKVIEGLAFTKIGTTTDLTDGEQSDIHKISSMGTMRLAKIYMESTEESLKEEIRVQEEKGKMDSPVVQSVINLYRQNHGNDSDPLEDPIRAFEEAMVEYTARTQASFQANTNLNMDEEQDLSRQLRRIYAKSKEIEGFNSERQTAKEREEARIHIEAVENTIREFSQEKIGEEGFNNLEEAAELFDRYIQGNQEANKKIIAKTVYGNLKSSNRRNLTKESFRRGRELVQATNTLRQSDEAQGQDENLLKEYEQVSLLAIQATNQRGYLDTPEKHHKVSLRALQSVENWVQNMGQQGVKSILRGESYADDARRKIVSELVAGFGLTQENNDIASERDREALVKAMFEGYDPDPEKDTSAFRQLLKHRMGVEEQVKYIDQMINIEETLRQKYENQDSVETPKEKLEKEYREAFEKVKSIVPGLGGEYSEVTGEGEEAIKRLERAKNQVLETNRTLNQEEIDRSYESQLIREQQQGQRSEFTSGILAPAILTIGGSGFFEDLDERAALFGYDVLQSVAETSSTPKMGGSRSSVERNIIGGGENLSVAATAFRMQRARAAIEGQDTLIQGAIAGVAQEAAIKTIGQASQQISQRIQRGGGKARTAVATGLELVGDAVTMGLGRAIAQSPIINRSERPFSPEMYEMLEQQAQQILAREREQQEAVDEGGDVITFVYNEIVDFNASTKPTLRDEAELGLRVLNEDGEESVIATDTKDEEES